MSRIDELNDNCFTLSTEFINEICSEFEAEVGISPTIDELCELLLWGIKSNSSDILRDINVANITELKAKISKRKKVSAKRGDIIAVPTKNKLYHLIIYLGRFGSFGDAFGIILGKYKIKPFHKEWHPDVFPRHIFSGLQFVASGRWKIIGSMPHLLERFPDEPEYYHLKTDHPDDSTIGKYGSAETPYKKDGTGSKIRKLSQNEAKELKLEEVILQSALEEMVEKYIEEVNRPNK